MSILDDLLKPPAKTVKPRVRTYQPLPVVAIADGEIITENGELLTQDQLIQRLPTMPPTLFVAVMAARFLSELDRQYSQTTVGWQYRITNNERNVSTPEGQLIATRITVAISYFGWKNRNYHKLIDPVTMYGHSLDRIWPGDGSRASRLLQWGVALRDFCADNDLEVRPTIGGIASQFLRDKRFYPEPRRKVPQATNQSVREHLPGNHYRLFVEPEKDEYSAYYLDQSAAHHYHAIHTPMPHADHLYAYGRFLTLEDVCFPDVVEGFYGLYCLDLEWKHAAKFSWLPYPENGRLEKQFVFSNELSHLHDMGYRVTGVRAAWGGRVRDTGIARYAQWARTETAAHNGAPWLKPLLLATYGILATTPRTPESIFRIASRGEPTEVLTGGRPLPGLLVKGSRKLEPGIANVLHRAMIEAATRSESVGLAQMLDAQGKKILAIYADAVIVEDDGAVEPPELIEPWRLKQKLNHLIFLNQQAFVSGEMVRLPGISGIARTRTLRAHAPRMAVNVERAMEIEETAEQLMSQTSKRN